MIYVGNELVAKQGSGLWGLALRMQSKGLARGKKGERQILSVPCLPCSGLLEPFRFLTKVVKIKLTLQMTEETSLKDEIAFLRIFHGS